MYETIRKMNLEYHLYQITDAEFTQYAQIVTTINTSSAAKKLNTRPIPKQGNVYVASDEALEQLAIAHTIQKDVFGGLPVQVGYCNGHTDRMNCLEWHQTPELNWFTEDVVLFLGDVREIHNNQYATANTKAFFVPAGTMIVLYGTTLHYAPCQTSLRGYRCLVALLKGVNSSLSTAATGQKQVLLATDKWLIAHSESDEAKNGAFVGLSGNNYQVKIN